MKIIYDCDNTMGVPGCDIVDGLSLLYLLGKEELDICAITTTYGNSKVDIVYQNTVNMLSEIGRRDIPVYKGCTNRYGLDSEATDYLVKMVNDYPGEISILATGALTNLYAAYVKDQGFFRKLERLVVMGGLTQEVLPDGKAAEEWNFAVDPAAVHWVLKEGQNLSVITRDRGGRVSVAIADFIHRLTRNRSAIGRYIVERSMLWLEYTMLQLKSNSLYLGDLAAAAYLVHPQFFENQQQLISLSTKTLSKGLLCPAENGREGQRIHLPTLRDRDGLVEEIYRAWLKLDCGPANIIPGEAHSFLSPALLREEKKIACTKNYPHPYRIKCGIWNESTSPVN